MGRTEEYDFRIVRGQEKYLADDTDGKATPELTEE